MLGFAFCGSFCNFQAVLPLLEEAKEKFGEILPIMSENARHTDTRFFGAEEFAERVRNITGKTPLSTIVETEPIGPLRMIDMLVVCPCTGNTLSKLAHGITDTSVTMAVKSHLRAGGKVLIALSTNDALSGSFESIARMKNRKNVFFTPMCEDDPEKKPYSLSFVKSLLIPSITKAYEGHQLSPLFLTDTKANL